MIGTKQDFSFMGDPALQTALQFAQRANDTPTFLALTAEASKRKKMRAASQGAEAGADVAAEGPTTVADKVMSGIANLSSGDHTYAGGGIISFAGGGRTAASFGEFLRQQGVQPADYKGLPKAAQDTLRMLYDNATLGPQPAAAPPAASPATPVTAAQGTPKPQMSLKGMARPYGATALLGGTVDTAMTDTEDYRKRFGMETDDPTFWGDVGVRSLGWASDVGNAALLGLPGLMYRDKQAAAAAPLAAAAKAAPTAKTPPAQASYSNEGRSPRTTFYQAPAPASPQGGGGGGGVAAVKNAQEAAAAAPPPVAAVAIEKTMTPEELKARAEAMAKGDTDKVEAIYAKAAERDAKRRAEIEGESAKTKGWLGAEMSGDTRKALRDFGIAALQSKSTNALGGIGEGLAAASKGYDERKDRRQQRLDLLDAAEEKRQLAVIAAQQGNMDMSRKYIADSETLKQQAFANRTKAEETAFNRWAKQQELTNDAARTRATVANAGRNPQMELYRALGGGDLRAGYQFANESKAFDRPITKAKAYELYIDAKKQDALPPGVSDVNSFYQYLQSMQAGAGGGAGSTVIPPKSAIQAELARRQGAAAP